MSIGHTEEGTLLHHYTSVEKALSMLESGQVWLSSMSNVNDPKEFSDWELSCIPGRNKISVNEWDEISSAISKESKRVSKIACFSEDTLTHHTSPINRYIELGCIGRGFANSPMWHFYGEKHTGCCLMFDKLRLVQEFENQTAEYTAHSNSVKYIDEKLPRNIGFEPYYFELDKVLEHGVSQYTKQFLGTRFIDLYFKKQSVWSYENEYRFYVLDDTNLPFKLNFANALSYICFGVVCSESDKKKIREFTQRHGFSTQEIKFKNHTVQVVM